MPTAIFRPVVSQARTAEPKLSWRVALLPFLGHQELYEAFHLNEPWDSPHNKALIGRMPDVFTTPSSPAGPGTTRIRGFEGPGAMFDGTRGCDHSGNHGRDVEHDHDRRRARGGPLDPSG